MKRLSLVAPLAALALLPQTAVAQSSTPGNTTFFCGNLDSVPVTIARTSTGEVPIIFWNSPDLGESDSNPQERCEDVSAKLQTYYECGELNYITTGRYCPAGRESCQDFACVAQDKDEGCKGRFLFPLKLTDPYDTPGNALQRIMRIRVSSDTPPTGETPPNPYVNMQEYLNGEDPQPPLPPLPPSQPRPPSPYVN